MTYTNKSQAQTFVDRLPHCRELNIRVEETGEARAILSLPYDERLIGDPDTGVVHGGAVSVLMDTCAGAAIKMHPQSSGAVATLDLRIDYMRAARPGVRITAEADCYHVTRTVAFIRVLAWDTDREKPVATASAAFTFVPKSPSNEMQT
jgi:uncharacterized protein (TIGR00369 family)